MPTFDTQAGQLLFAGFPELVVPDDLAELISAGRLGGVVLFGRNIEGPDQVRALVAELHGLAPAEAPLCVAIDQEGGRVQRLRAPWTEFPPMRVVGEHDRIEDTMAIASALGRELRDMGIDLDFAPSCDVDSNPDNPVIGDRSFGRTPEVVGRHAVAFIEGLQGTGVAGCAKHFPGHGDTHTDSHLTLPRLDPTLERLLSIELPPFREALSAGVASVMTAHVILESLAPDVPATLSSDAIALLREELRYDGLVFTDDLEMRAIADHYTPTQIVDGAIAAGVDAFLVCSKSVLRDEILAALEALPKDRLIPSLLRMKRFKASWLTKSPVATTGAPPYEAHRRLAEKLTSRQAIA